MGKRGSVWPVILNGLYPIGTGSHGEKNVFGISYEGLDQINFL